MGPITRLFCVGVAIVVTAFLGRIIVLNTSIEYEPTPGLVISSIGCMSPWNLLSSNKKTGMGQAGSFCPTIMVTVTHMAGSSLFAVLPDRTVIMSDPDSPTSYKTWRLSADQMNEFESLAASLARIGSKSFVNENVTDMPRTRIVICHKPGQKQEIFIEGWLVQHDCFSSWLQGGVDVPDEIKVVFRRACASIPHETRPWPDNLKLRLIPIKEVEALRVEPCPASLNTRDVEWIDKNASAAFWFSRENSPSEIFDDICRLTRGRAPFKIGDQVYDLEVSF